MPQFDLDYIQIAKHSGGSSPSYSQKQQMGDAMTVQLQLTYAEGRLYAESSLAEYIKEATGGTISAGVKYIKDAAQKLMFGFKDKSRSIGSGSDATSISSLVSSTKDKAAYVGMSFYCPDMIDGTLKFTAVFVRRALFGPPGYSYQTKGQNIQFATPTTTGEFLPDTGSDKALFEVAVCDSREDAIAWCDLVLGGTAPNGGT